MAAAARRKKQRTIPESLSIARQLVTAGNYDVEPGVLDELHDLGFVGEDLHLAIKAAFDEVTPRCYRPLKKEFTTPGLPFVWDSTFFARRMYLKFSLEGTRHRPRVFVWSCHEPYFGSQP